MYVLQYTQGLGESRVSTADHALLLLRMCLLLGERDYRAVSQ
jgi:hypothetical protein